MAADENRLNPFASAPIHLDQILCNKMKGEKW
jgi:hypothetical protein